MRLEIFTSDLQRSLDFYVGVLEFEPRSDAAGGYRELAAHDTRIALQTEEALGPGHPLGRPGPKGLGLELVLEVDDIDGFYARVSERWPVEGRLERRPWGLRDFWVLDPDEIYWRVTHPE